MEYAQPVSEQELQKINSLLANVHIAISMSMAYIRKFQGWEFNQLEQRFTGVSVSTWKRYLQPSYNKMRPLHVVAAYSWLTMLPMPCFYRGLNIREAYPLMDDVSVECLIHSGLLPKEQFRLILSHLHEYLTDEQRVSIDQYKYSLSEELGLLENYDDADFMFPQVLDMDKFGDDYYSSLTISFKKFRDFNKIPMETMAHVLNLSLHRYKQCENPDNPVPLPVELGARLQVGFRLPNVMPFTTYMKIYPQFHTVRKVQQLRQLLLTEIMRYISSNDRKKIGQAMVEICINNKKIDFYSIRLEKSFKKLSRSFFSE